MECGRPGALHGQGDFAEDYRASVVCLGLRSAAGDISLPPSLPLYQLLSSLRYVLRLGYMCAVYCDAGRDYIGSPMGWSDEYSIASAPLKQRRTAFLFHFQCMGVGRWWVYPAMGWACGLAWVRALSMWLGST